MRRPHQAYVFHSAINTWMHRTKLRLMEEKKTPVLINDKLNLQDPRQVLLRLWYHASRSALIDPLESDQTGIPLLGSPKDSDETATRMVAWFRQAYGALAIRAYFEKAGPVVANDLASAAISGTDLFAYLIHESPSTDKTHADVKLVLSHFDGLVEDLGDGLRFQHEALIPTLAAEGAISAWDRLEGLRDPFGKPSRRRRESPSAEKHVGG